MQTISELKKLDHKQLQDALEKERNNLYKIRLTVKGEKKTPPSDVKKSKKHIARILTVINETKNSNNQ